MRLCDRLTPLSHRFRKLTRKIAGRYVMEMKHGDKVRSHKKYSKKFIDYFTIRFNQERENEGKEKVL